jgi:hypothetical protein
MREYEQEIKAAGRVLAVAVADEMALEAKKPLQKSAAIQRLVGSENPENGKAHSASSAEKVVESDPTYAAFLAEVRQAVFQKIVARANYDASVAAARLAASEVTV